MCQKIFCIRRPGQERPSRCLSSVRRTAFKIMEVAATKPMVGGYFYSLRNAHKVNIA